MNVEIWKDVVGYENLYQVSNAGRVRSVNRTILDANGKIVRYKGKELRLRQKGGYSYALLCNGHEKAFRVHRLVAFAFIPTSDTTLQVNHINGDKLDNRVENLEWCTASENQKHSYKVLGKKKSRFWRGKSGAEHPLSKRIVNIVTGDVYSSVKECAEMNNMKRRTLSNMLSGNRTNKTPYRYETDSIRFE